MWNDGKYGMDRHQKFMFPFFFFAQMIAKTERNEVTFLQNNILRVKEKEKKI